MSYDGFYSELSSRGTANDALNQIVTLKDKVVVLAAEAEVSADRSENAAAIAEVKSTEAINSAASALTSKESAEISETSAGLSAQQAAIALVATSRFCGVSAIAPSTRLDGSELQEADEYQNSEDHLRYSWTGTVWVSLNSSAHQLEERLGSPDGSSLLGAPVAGTVEQALPMVSVAQFGAIGSGNGTGAFNAAVTAAISAGHKRVFVPFPLFTVNDNADAKGCELYGSGTVLTGRIIGSAAMHNIVVNRNTSYRAWHPEFKTDASNKLIRNIDAVRQQVYVSKKSKGYVMLTMRSDATTTTDSLAKTTSDTNSIRVTSVVNIVDIVLGYTKAKDSVGTVTLVNLNNGIAEPFDGDTSYYRYPQLSGGVGNYFETEIEVPQDGHYSLTFLRTAGSSSAITITANGSDVESGISLVSPSNRLETRAYRATPGLTSIRITNNAASGVIHFVGCNVSKLKDARIGVSIDTLGVYRNGAAYSHYVSNSSANDYAILDSVTKTWGGSFHGGEKNINTRYLLDGTEKTLVAGALNVCQSLEIRSKFNIDWSEIGGPVLSARTSHEFGLGGYAFRSSFAGEIIAESIFTTLYGVSVNFSEVVSPVIGDLSSMPSPSRLFFGKQNRVAYQDPTTGQSLTITHSTFSDEDNDKGGAYVYVVDGQYYKYYYAWIDRGKRLCNDIAAVTIVEFG